MDISSENIAVTEFNEDVKHNFVIFFLICIFIFYCMILISHFHDIYFPRRKKLSVFVRASHAKSEIYLTYMFALSAITSCARRMSAEKKASKLFVYQKNFTHTMLA